MDHPLITDSGEVPTRTRRVSLRFIFIANPLRGRGIAAPGFDTRFHGRRRALALRYIAIVGRPTLQGRLWFPLCNAWSIGGRTPVDPPRYPPGAGALGGVFGSR